MSAREEKPFPHQPDTDDDTGELPPLLDAGDVLAGRYRIATVRQDGAGRVYRAEDLWRCVQCGNVAPPRNGEPCAVCGTSFENRPLCTIRLVDSGTLSLSQARGAEVLDVHGLLFLVVPDGVATGGVPSRGLRLRSGTGSDAGRVRQTDEDSLLAINVSSFHLGRAETCLGLFALADGIGGLASGATASHLALCNLASDFGARVLLADLDGDHPPEQLVKDLADAVHQTNAYLFSRQPQTGQPSGQKSSMGTTLTVAYVRGRLVSIANVGDSRTYRWREGHLEQLTVDHSLVAGLVRAGLAKPEDVYTHPQRSLITRSLGDQPSVEVDTFLYDIAPGDRLMLCCDGIWEMLRDEDLADILRAEPDPQRAATAMIARANDNGGEDNLSVIVVAVEEVGT